MAGDARQALEALEARARGRSALHSRAARRGLLPARGPLVDNHGRRKSLQLAFAESSRFQRAPASRQTRGIRRSALPARRLHAVVENFPRNESSMRRARQRRPSRLRGREGGAGVGVRRAQRQALHQRPAAARDRGGARARRMGDVAARPQGLRGRAVLRGMRLDGAVSALRLRYALGGTARAAVRFRGGRKRRPVQNFLRSSAKSKKAV